MGAGAMCGRASEIAQEGDRSLREAAVKAALAELEAAASVEEQTEEVLDAVIDALDEIPAFALDGKDVRKLTQEYVAMLEVAAPSFRRFAPDATELIEAVVRRFSNLVSSRYECKAKSTWPAYAKFCPDLMMTFCLERTGIVTYKLSDSTDSDACTWELAGEGCWKVLPEDGRPTEIVIELRQGLEGTAPVRAGVIETVHEGPRSIKVDICSCVRVPFFAGGADCEEEEEDDSCCNGDGGYVG